MSNINLIAEAMDDESLPGGDEETAASSIDKIGKAMDGEGVAETEVEEIPAPDAGGEVLVADGAPDLNAGDPGIDDIADAIGGPAETELEPVEAPGEEIAGGGVVDAPAVEGPDGVPLGEPTGSLGEPGVDAPAGGAPSGVLKLEAPLLIKLLELASKGGLDTAAIASKAGQLSSTNECLTMDHLGELGVDATMGSPTGAGPQLDAAAGDLGEPGLDGDGDVDGIAAIAAGLPDEDGEIEGGEIVPVEGPVDEGGEAPIEPALGDDEPLGDEPGEPKDESPVPPAPKSDKGEDKPKKDKEEKKDGPPKSDKKEDKGEDKPKEEKKDKVEESVQAAPAVTEAATCDCGKDPCECDMDEEAKSKKPWEKKVEESLNLELNKFVNLVSDSGGVSVIKPTEKAGEMRFNGLVQPQARKQLAECIQKALQHKPWLQKNGFNVLAECKSVELRNDCLVITK
jgi:hypothetical protein